MKSEETLWGVDLGGTKIEGVVLTKNTPHEVLCRMRIPTEKHKGYQHIIERIGHLLDLMKEETGVEPTHLGIGTPGNTDPKSGLHKNSNTTSLNGMPFKKDLQDYIGIPLRLANDANCFAIAETKMGIVAEKVPDAEVVFGVIMGTGVGSGIVVNGKVLNGCQGIAGEWGHNFLDASGGRCYCGRIGCVETIISGTGLERYYKTITGTEKKLKEIYQLHLDNADENATKTIERMIHFFGKAIGNIINILDPHAIVLGGGVGNIDLLYTEGVKAAEEFVFNDRIDTPFLKPKLGDSAGVFGAAFL
ncbi:MAG: ROK family protein [Bacteroidota bacterium]